MKQSVSAAAGRARLTSAIFWKNHHHLEWATNRVPYTTAMLSSFLLAAVCLVSHFPSAVSFAAQQSNSVRPWLSSPVPKTTSLFAVQEASFGMGCFWQPAEDLLKVDGVLDTVCGYTGESATAKPPSYDSVCYSRNNWVEGVRVRYDDDIISYGQLLDAFFEYQKPQFGSRQYASVIFTHNDEQAAVAEEWKAKKKVRSDGIPSFATTIEPLTVFYQAEEYHQRYWAKFRPRMAATFVLLLVSSGAVDNWLPTDWLSNVHTGASGTAIAGAVWLMAERKFQTKTAPI